MSDSRELAHAPRQSDTLLAQVMEAAKNPDIDAAKMETLARLVNSQQDREREIEFNQAKNEAIQRMPVLTKDGRIIITKDGHSREQGRFAKWEDIDRVVRPLLAGLNLALSFDIAEKQGGGLTVTPILSHANGYTQRGGAFPVPMEKSGSKNEAQAMGSAASYGKRYAACGMLNIVTEGVDDDGNLGRGTTVSMPHERQQTVLAEAQVAHEAGRYQEWFTTQSPKDRGWLVSSGKHAEFGGQVTLPPPKSNPPSSTRSEPGPPAATGSADTGPPASEEPPQRRTPLQMVEDFEKRLDEVTEKRGVIDLQAEPKVARWIGNLEQQYPDLHQRVLDYAAKRYSTLAAAERDKARAGSDSDRLV